MIDINTGITALLFIIAIIVGVSVLDDVTENVTNAQSAVNESLGTADASGYIEATLDHTPIRAPSIQCVG